MSLEKQLPHTPILSKADKAQLALIESAGKQSLPARVAHIALASIIPGFFAALYGYVQYQASHAGLALCRLQRGLYIPEHGQLEKILRYPIAVLIITAVLWGFGAYHIQSQRRLMHRLFFQVFLESNEI